MGRKIGGRTVHGRIGRGLGAVASAGLKRACPVCVVLASFLLVALVPSGSAGQSAPCKLPNKMHEGQCLHPQQIAKLKKEKAKRQAEAARQEAARQEAARQPQAGSDAARGNDVTATLEQLQTGSTAEVNESGRSTAGVDDLPERLNVSQVMKGFNARKGAMENCVRMSGEATPFSAKANVEIEGSGRVASVKMVGGGYAKGCLEGVLRTVVFDRFSGPNMKVPYIIKVN